MFSWNFKCGVIHKIQIIPETTNNACVWVFLLKGRGPTFDQNCVLKLTEESRVVMGKCTSALNESDVIQILLQVQQSQHL